MNTSKRLIGILLALCMAAGMFSVPVMAADAPVYLALGDSISTGYGLPDGVPGFVDRIAEAQPSCILVNRSVNGNTAAGVYEQLRDGTMDDLLLRAGLITLTCGGNDLMAVLYEKIANLYNADHPSAPIAPAEITVIFNGEHPTLKGDDLMDYATAALEGLAGSDEFQAGLLAFTDALTKVVAYIRAVNPDAQLVIPTQYNPYNSFENLLFYRSIYAEIEAGVLLLNDVIRSHAKSLDYIAADVYAAFHDSTENLCNAKASFLGSPNLDFHPNSAGHIQIAQVLLQALAGPSISISNANLSDGCVTVSLTNADEGTLAAAFYGQNGAMIDLDMHPVTDSSEITLLAELSDNAETVRVFLLDSVTGAPLAPHAAWSAAS